MDMFNKGVVVVRYKVHPSIHETNTPVPDILTILLQPHYDTIL